MTLKRNLLLAAIALVLVALVGIGIASANIINVNQPTPPSASRFIDYTFFATTTGQLTFSTTTNATSTTMAGWFDASGSLDTGALNIAGAKAVTFYFGRTGINGNSGNTRFSVQVSPDGANWYYWGKWIENASSTSGFTPLTTNAYSFVVSGTSTLVESMNLTNDAFLYARVVTVKTTDGEAYASSTVQY